MLSIRTISFSFAIRHKPLARRLPAPGPILRARCVRDCASCLQRMSDTVSSHQMWWDASRRFAYALRRPSLTRGGDLCAGTASGAATRLLTFLVNDRRNLIDFQRARILLERLGSRLNHSHSIVNRRPGPFVLTAFPSGLVASIPSAIPKNPVGSYQLWTDCIRGLTGAFFSGVTNTGLPNTTSAVIPSRYRQVLSNAIPAELRKATILIAVARLVRKHTTRAATVVSETYRPHDRKMLRNRARRRPKHQPARSIPCQGAIATHYRRSPSHEFKGR
jgi:hypothetical protein